MRLTHAGVVYSFAGLVFYKLYGGDLELLTAREILANAKFGRMARRTGFRVERRVGLEQQAAKIGRLLKIIAK